MLRLRQTDPHTDDWQIVPEFADPQLEVLRLLHEACQIEHALMLQYLYAAYSVRPEYAQIVGTPNDPATLEKLNLLGIAIDEMQHLRSVNGILRGLGASPSLSRPAFPHFAGIYPFPMELEPLSRRSLAKYLYAEAPSGALSPDGRDPELADEVRRVLETIRPAGADAPVTPDARHHIGSLYKTILSLMERIPGEAGRRKQWIETLERVRTEGETEHFTFFAALFRGDRETFGRSGVWDEAEGPSIALPTNPSALSPPLGVPSAAAEMMRLGNRVYWSLLIVLDQTYRLERGASGDPLLGEALSLMTLVLHPLAVELAKEGFGLPFDPLPLALAPCLEPSTSLEAAADLLDAAHEGLAPLRSASRAWLADLEGPLDRARARVRRAVQVTGTTVVIGAGPAGLAAAFALADRGVPVRLLERGHVVGGKVHSEEIEIEGEAAPKRLSVEHGVHGWWPSYRNFFSLLERCGVDLDRAFLPEEKTSLVIPDAVHTMGPFWISLPSPLFLAAQIWSAPYLDGLRDLLKMVPFTIHVLAFRHEEDYGRYDEESLDAFLQRNDVPAAARDYLFRPFVLNLDYALPHEVSAASVLSAFQFYALPSEDALLPRWTRGLPQRVVFGPLAKGIETRGGRVERSTSVTRLLLEDGVLAAVDVQARGIAPSHQEIAEVAVSEIPADGFAEFPTEVGVRFFARQPTPGDFLVFADVCTHLGGRLDWKGSFFECALHHGRFDDEGKVGTAPPSRPLRSLEWKADGDKIRIYGSPASFPIRCTDAIVATDLAAARAILAASPGVPAGLVSDLEKLETSAVLVVRMWFPKGTPLTHGDRSTAVTPAGEIVDNYFHLNAFDPSYDHEGEVVEIQGCRDPERWDGVPDEEVVRLVLHDLKQMGLYLPDVPPPVHAIVTRHPDLFTKYSPGSERFRPGADSGVPGLFLAGDWTRADWSVWFMERAVVSGLRAANEVLRRRGLEEFPILRLEPEGPLLRLSRAVSRALRSGLGL